MLVNKEALRSHFLAPNQHEGLGRGRDSAGRNIGALDGDGVQDALPRAHSAPGPLEPWLVQRHCQSHLSTQDSGKPPSSLLNSEMCLKVRWRLQVKQTSLSQSHAPPRKMVSKWPFFRLSAGYPLVTNVANSLEVKVLF